VTSTESRATTTLLEAYRRMLTIRWFEQRCFDLSSESIAGSIHLCGGQEAIPVGARMVLRADDRVVATYRGHGWAIEWGIPLTALLAEICQRAGGLNGGRAGSPYLMAPERGFIGENSIVGAGVPIGAGVAMAAKLEGTGRICIVSIGEGAMNQGATHEGLNFAAARDLPVVFVVENNDWSEMTPSFATSRLASAAERAASYGMPGVTVDGTDLSAVGAAVEEAAARGRDGRGPTLIEARAPRLMAHYNRDIEHYRTTEDKALGQARDPLPRLRAQLEENGVPTAEITAVEAAVLEELDAVTAAALAMPAPDPATAGDHVFAARRPRPRVTVQTPGQTPGELPYWRAVNQALRDELASRPELVVYGEDVGYPGGIFGCTRGLQSEFGVERVFDTPISESAILGSAIGASIEGMRPVVEIMWADFMLVALDQLVNQAANVRYVTQGRQSVPIVVRMQQGATPGSCAQHSQSLEALLAHVPGLRIGLPAHPDDAYRMLRAAIDDPDPTIIIEARGLYQTKGPVSLEGPVESIGGATFRRRGNDLAIIAWGAMSLKAEEAADRLAAEGVAASVLDLRWLSPLDEEAIAEAVTEGGGRVLVVHEANLTGGFGAEIAARIGERFFEELDSPVMRLAAPDVRIPSAPALQEAVVPQIHDIVEASRRLVGK
jgi:2-oxoisovalerate dehydrogenase E1 component